MNVSLNNPVLREILPEKYLNYFAHIYRKEIGPVEKVTQLVVNSDACNKFLFRCLENKNISPTPYDFVYTVSSSRYFMFSKSETICLASIFLLSRLESKINKTIHRHEYIYNYKEALADISIGIIKRSLELKVHVRNVDFYTIAIEFAINQHYRDEKEYYSNQRDFYSR